MNDNDDDVPVEVFAGPYAEALFVKTLVESAGIKTHLEELPSRAIALPSKVYVRRADVEHASELVADFRKNGHRTSY